MSNMLTQHAAARETCMAAYDGDDACGNNRAENTCCGFVCGAHAKAHELTKAERDAWENSLKGHPTSVCDPCYRQLAIVWARSVLTSADHAIQHGGNGDNQVEDALQILCDAFGFQYLPNAARV
ncbi:MAG: hypothetical protein JWO85_242 [Candidatus Eremiobacteraeota bacterium]|nr:hypothetical protein [Candidatus Eremiobacteraeota bacterium]